MTGPTDPALRAHTSQHIVECRECSYEGAATSSGQEALREPRTKAGKATAALWRYGGNRTIGTGSIEHAIVNIEDEAAALAQAAPPLDVGVRQAVTALLDAERGLGPVSHSVAVANLRSAVGLAALRSPDTETAGEAG